METCELLTEIMDFRLSLEIMDEMNLVAGEISLVIEVGDNGNEASLKQTFDIIKVIAIYYL